MSKPTTIRLPEPLLRELDRRARARGQERAAFLRALLRAALARDLEAEVIAEYAAGRLSLSAAASRLGTDPWAVFDLLRRHGVSLNVTIEDWIDSRASVRRAGAR